MDAQALGRHLRQTREAREVTLEQAEAALKIRARILESFELGEFTVAEAASTLQVRGFIRNYAQYLGLDADVVMQQYDAALVEGERRARGKNTKKNGKRDTGSAKAANDSSSNILDTQRLKPAPKPIPVSTPPSSPSIPVPPNRTSPLVVLVRLLVAAAAIAVIAFVIIQYVQVPAGGETTATEAAPDILGALPPTLANTPAASPTFLSVSTQVGVLSAYNGQGLLVEITMAQRAWMQITADNIEQFTGVARPGQQFAITAADNVQVMSANAEGLDVIFNGQPQPRFGMRGQRVDITFRMDGIEVSSNEGFAPTPIASDTPLPTPTDPAGALIAQLTPTLTPSLTPSEGPSPTITDTPMPSETPTETYTPSITPTFSDTPTETPIPTDTVPPTATLTPSLTFTPSQPPTNTPLPTATLTPSATRTPSHTPTAPPTLTPSPTAILPPRATPANPTPTKTGA